MRCSVLLTAAAGCNPVFGIEPTELRSPPDAAFFDAPADAPFACPPAGETPAFSRLLHQIPERCTGYEVSTVADRVVATCSETNPPSIKTGPMNGALTTVMGLTAPGTERIDAPHIAPEGDQLFVRHWNTSTVTGRIRVFELAGDVATPAHDVTLAGVTFDSFVKVARPSAGPVRRIFMINPPSSNPIELSVDASGIATVEFNYTPADFEVDNFFSVPNLSNDGLHAVFAAGKSGMGNAIVYAARTSITEKFTSTAVIFDVPTTPDPFMTDDCGRLYFSAIGSVFWLQRI